MIDGIEHFATPTIRALPKYKYKVNDNYEGSLPVSIEGVALYDTWTSFMYPQEKLNRHIKTLDNPKGMVDFEEWKEDEKIKSPSDFTDIIFYSRDALTTYPRKQIEQICNKLNISTQYKLTPFLINKIVEKQEEIKLAMKKDDIDSDLNPEANLEVII